MERSRREICKKRQYKNSRQLYPFMITDQQPDQRTTWAPTHEGNKTRGRRLVNRKPNQRPPYDETSLTSDPGSASRPDLFLHATGAVGARLAQLTPELTWPLSASARECLNKARREVMLSSLVSLVRHHPHHNSSHTVGKSAALNTQLSYFSFP